MRVLATVVASLLGASALSAASAVEADADAVRTEAFRFAIAWRTDMKLGSWLFAPTSICLGQGTGREHSLRDLHDPAPAVLDALPQSDLTLAPWSRCPTPSTWILIGDMRWMDPDRADVTVAFESECELSYGLTLELFRAPEGWRLDEDFARLSIWGVDY
jgi:hypothetical protein